MLLSLRVFYCIQQNLEDLTEVSGKRVKDLTKKPIGVKPELIWQKELASLL